MDHIEINFRAFHMANPHVYRMFSALAFEAIRRGFNRGSASFIFEMIRWETALTTTPIPGGNPKLKLSNNYRSRYARLWMKDNPSRIGFFRTRPLSANSADSQLIKEKYPWE